MEATSTLQAGERTLVLYTDGHEVTSPDIAEDRDELERKRDSARWHGGGDWQTVEIPLSVALAAPELLEMLQITLDRMTLHPERTAETNYRLARALIAKVKGVEA